MRVTNLMLQRSALADVSRARTLLARTQEQASSGLRINRPSDDPVGAREAAALRARLEAVAQLERNVGQADLRLRAADEAFSDVNNILIRARELAIQGANDTLDAQGRLQIAAEVEALHGQLLAVGNVRRGGAHIFSGFASDTAPFVASGPFTPSLPAPSVAFVGDANEVEIEIEEGVRMASTSDGRRVFLGDGDGDGAPDAGKEDLFEVLADLRDALVADDRSATAAVLSRIDVAQTQIGAEQANLGGRAQRLEAALGSLARRRVSLTDRLSQVQDADTIQVYSDLVQHETLLRASLEATARLVQPSLLDFLS